MIKFYMTGGIGNQIFQWVFCEWLNLISGSAIQAVQTPGHNPHEQSSISALFSGSESVRHGDWNSKHDHLQFKLAHRMWSLIERDVGLSGQLIPKKFPFRMGYHQTWYFRDELEKLQFDYFDKFIPNSPLREEPIIHIRRGDYLSRTQDFGLLGEDYYLGALEQLDVGKKAQLYVASDSPDIADALLRKIGYRRIEMVETSPIKTLLFAQQFRRQVISNSTFSWWFSNLNPRPAEYDVVAPDPWFWSISGPTAIIRKSWRRQASNFSSGIAS